MTEKLFVWVCCDCGVWSEERPNTCLCGSQCFTKEEIEVDENELEDI